MAWAWSHTQQGYDDAREQLATQTKAWLATALAEWLLQEELAEDGPLPYGIGSERLTKLIDGNAIAWSYNELVEIVWGRAERYAACSNGGHMLWMCPSGCHSVPPNPVEMEG